jgi:hypothetical protein
MGWVGHVARVGAIISGNIFVGKHDKIKQLRKPMHEEPVCGKCGMGEETAHHVLFECEALGHIRYSVLGPPGFEIETVHQEPIKPLLDLIRKAGIFDGI